MDKNALFRVNPNGCFFYEDSELRHEAGQLQADAVVIYLGEHVEDMIFYDICWTAMKVLTPTGVAWRRPGNLSELSETR